MRRMEACAWVNRRNLRAYSDLAIDAVGGPHFLFVLSPRVVIPVGNCNSSSNVWEKLINPNETPMLTNRSSPDDTSGVLSRLNRQTVSDSSE
jgi:hypothetical protein